MNASRNLAAAEVELQKQALRHELLARRACLRPAEVAEWSRGAVERLLRLSEFLKAAVVGCYLAKSREVQTESIVAECRSKGKILAVPRWDGARNSYGWAILPADGVLRKGRFGVSEPVDQEWVRVEELDVVIVPGVAFDKRGCRLGHGAGHFDRLLRVEETRSITPPLRIGLAFDFQVLEEVPCAEHDVPMQVVVTERRTIRCQRP